MSSSYPFFVTCPIGLEDLLVQELKALGGRETRATVAGVKAQGDLAFAYRACLWSRLANKVLLALGQFPAADADALYRSLADIDWSRHMPAAGSLWIDVSGTNQSLRNSQYTAQIAKDAIVDQFRSSSGERPSIQREQPDLTLSLRLHRDQVAVNVDLCGESLHKRGYRLQSVTAPLKENLAAALLIRAGWLDTAANNRPLIDPMCGSGTLLIEAGMMAADIAPGLGRREFAFQRWPQHQASIWDALTAQAESRRQAGLAQVHAEIRGYDVDPRAVAASQVNAEAAGVDGMVRVMVKSLTDFTRPTHGDFSQGLLITNPPYGERLGEEEALLPLYGQLGDTLKREFGNWRAAVFTGNPELGKSLGLRSHKQYKFFNGAIASELLLFDIFPSEGRRQPAPAKPDTLSDGAQMVANRLEKNCRKLRPWARQRGINCYRVYDADLPEYAAAIDYYAGKIHIQEYRAPKSVAANAAQQRLRDLVAAAKSVFAVEGKDLSVKQRSRQRGKQQYQKLETATDTDFFTVAEGRAKFAVNLWSYLDTGVFLDHRLVREKLASMVMGKTLLNLFCYTATATVQAALAGASSSVSVDMSKTYLEWAQNNFDLNNIGKDHRLVQADCLTWLQQCRQGFDLILLDPPSFSNSKRMQAVLDVQRDHISLIKRCLELLKPRGRLLFSTNLRKFKFDYDALQNVNVEDISDDTIDKDFERNPKIHQCFLISPH